MKKAFKIAAIILIFLAIGFWLFANSLKPTYNGSIDIADLETEVTVYYDDYGIPHIYSDNDKDAFTALGFVHAQDRLWQMELIRRIAPGKLSELFGEEHISTDRFFIGLGIDDASQLAFAKLDKSSPTYQLTQAYLKGINQFIEQGPTPIEFYTTGADKTSFTITDVHNIIGYMAFSFAMAHKTDPLLTNIKTQLGNVYLEDLEIDTHNSSTKIYNYSKTDSLTMPINLITSINKALEKLPIPQFIGSNSWVLAPEKTASGKVLFANDPHIGFAQPSVWYEAHIHTPNYEMYGYHLAGIPFPLLGHNNTLAYGMTMFENDDIDFYWEENHPTDSTKYKTADGWKVYQTKTKTIKVKGSEAITLTVKSTDHGPIMNSLADEITYKQPVAMSWIYTQHDNRVLEAVYKMSHATNQKEFEEGLPLIHAPGLNIMYGDAQNNIGWYAVGKLYELPENSHPKFILDGTNGKNEPTRYLDFSENPKATNPPWHYVYSANNQPDSIAGKLYPGYYLPENRAKRIVTLLESKNDWTKDDFKTMITDVNSPINADVTKTILPLIESEALTDNEKEAISILKQWNGGNQLQDIAPTIYHRFIYRYLENTFLDELGKEQFDLFLETHLSKRVIAPLLSKEQSIWFDNLTTKNENETRTSIINKSFSEAIASLEEQLGNKVAQWTWNRVHTLEHEHSFGKVKLLRSYFNVGPFEINGTREVINNLGFPYNDSGEYKVSSGPSTRRVIDFSDIENSISILPTGQSGNPFSPYYNDQAEMYTKGTFRQMLINLESIKKVSKNILILK